MGREKAISFQSFYLLRGRRKTGREYSRKSNLCRQSVLTFGSPRCRDAKIKKPLIESGPICQHVVFVYLEEVEYVVVLLRHVHARLEQVEQDAGRHDGAGVHHRVVRLVCN